MTPIERKAGEVLSEARSIIKKDAPYYAPTVYGFIPCPVTDIPQVKGTMGITKGMVLYFDPDWMATKPAKQIAAALVHEVQHHVRNHIERSEGFPDQEQANIAGDLAANPDLRNAGWELPHGLFPKEDYDFPEQLSMEEYYALLEKAKKKSRGGGGSKPGGCGAGKCGGIAGNHQKFEEALDVQLGRSTMESKAIAKQTASEIKSHVKQYGRGNIPASLVQDIEKGEEKSKIRWQDELRHYAKKASGRVESGGMDFSMSRPSKRSPARGFPRPGLVQYLPELAFVLDTSGSMGDGEIKAAVIEAIGIFKGIGIDSAWLLQADTRVSDKKKIRLRDLMSKMRITGRGGTHFDAALKAIEELKPRPDIVVYLSDGDGTVTYRPKGIEVIWCIVSSSWARSPPCDWGHVVMIEADGKKRRK